MIFSLFAQARVSPAEQGASDLFGKVKVETGPTDLYTKPVPEAIADIFVFGVTMVFVVAGLTVLIYMLWGAFNYITSAGEAEAVAAARGKMINAAGGMILLIVVLSLWVFLTQITGIITVGEGGFSFSLPRLGGDSEP